MVAHVFNPSTREAEADRSLESEASLVYRVNSRTVSTTQRTPFSKNQKLKEKEKNRKEERVAVVMESIHSNSPQYNTYFLSLGCTDRIEFQPMVCGQLVTTSWSNKIKIIHTHLLLATAEPPTAWASECLH